jgi:ribokinase
MSKEIVVFGSINKDFFRFVTNLSKNHLFSYVERFPNAGESVRGNKFYIGNGGKGANQAVTSAKLGASVTMIGMVLLDL